MSDNTKKPKGWWMVKHGHARAHKPSPTYRVWKGIRNRCYRPNEAAYKDYGAKGIRVCDRWLHSFAAFLADMGERPDGLQIDRIDPTGNYEPSNCRWVTVLEQARNRRPPLKRPPAVRSQCKHGHESTLANTRVNGRGHRYCRICARIHQQRYAAKKRGVAA